MKTQPKSLWLYILPIVLISSILLSSCGAPAQTNTKSTTLPATATPTPTPITISIPAQSETPTPTPIPTPTYPPLVPPASVLGTLADTIIPWQGIPWVRLSYDTCNPNKVQGNALKATVAQFHRMGVRVMLSVCQWATDSRLFNTTILNDAAQGGADAVQCGNEQMKSGQYNAYVPPATFARFFDLCTRAMHAVRPGIPIILGSLDPHVGGIDYQPLVDQANYLNAMQSAMNSQVHPGGNWNWRSQSVGLIDSWHNGYPDSSTNSLYWLFVFWSQQFHLALNSGGLGQHLWVIEGTGCIYGCGINTSSASAIAISHILTMITDVQTAMRYKVPFFYFSGRDFYSEGAFWPMGIRDRFDHPKPLRQDLWMGSRTLTMYCHSGSVTVQTQEQLIAKLYASCALPSNYISILTS